ncbi:hypothetical protein EGW08_007831 [Elysia chlorotica]|uniref:dCMP deaminase n=1 Tax=Elysia chlorotica TaxID=188477 RepID=A0A433TSB8_ELYCH|nr:hypothetical protein EGW08_007831 [Elysia chlorotica]
MYKMTCKRQNYLEWQEYFMSIAFLSAQRSKDPTTQVGACIVNKENKVVGIGYNGMPIGCNDDVMPWNRNTINGSSENWLKSKIPYVCHAELNAVLNKNCADVKGCIIYVALFPCNLCAQIIIQSGISDVVYYCDKYPEHLETRAAKHLMDMAGVQYRQFVPKQCTVEINFSLIEATAGQVPTLSTCHQICSDGASKSNDAVKEESSKQIHQDSSGNNTTSRNMSGKRQNYLEWEEYFMSMAFLSAQRSKDPRTQVGACIVNREKKIVGIGYNGMPIGCCDDIMPWNRATDKSDAAWLESKSPYVCHAELNAVLNKNSADIKGCTIYVALFPCNKCAQVVIQSGISDVVYYSDKYHDQPDFQASRHLLSTAGVTYRQFRPRQEKIIIDFGVGRAVEEDNSQTDYNEDTSENSGNAQAPIDTMSYTDENLNNNNVCKDQTSENENSIDQLNLENIIANSHALEASLEVGWMNEIQELRYALLSFTLAAAVAIFSWYTSSSKFMEFNHF